jgi:uncharacterized DUF497 family protein
LVRIHELLVSPRQEEHIWAKHRVTVDEVDDICLGPHWALRGREHSLAVFGQTTAGRYLVVFLYPRGAGVWSLATARNMTSSERRRYLQEGIG